jgi:hypothetical protein
MAFTFNTLVRSRDACSDDLACPTNGKKNTMRAHHADGAT